MASEIDNGIKILRDELLSNHTTFKIGGPAFMLAKAENIQQLASLVYMAKKNNLKYIVMGNGSNLLFSDNGYSGLVIKTTPGFGSIILEENSIIRAEAGALLSKVALAASESSLCGLEFAQGIPGTVGGALFMNAGSYGGEIANVVARTCVLDSNGSVRMMSRDEQEFGYRSSVFKNNRDLTVLYSEFKLTLGSKKEITDKMNDYKARRKESQPLEMPSAGSVFKRPQEGYAAQIIEECGLKGFAIGGAQVSPKHAGFIVNTGGATCQNVVDVMEHIEKTVLEQKNIKLEREIFIVED